MPVYGFRVPAVPRERRLLHATVEVEDLQRGIIASCHEFTVIGRKGEITHGVAMGLNSFDIIECRLPVFYNTFLICRDEPVFVMRPYCGSDS